MVPVEEQEAIPDDARVGEDDGTSFESLILSMLHYWSLRNEPQNVINMVEKHFTQDQMYTAHCSLKPAKAVTKCVVSKNRPASKAQAESLYNYMSKLNNENKLPKLTVNSEDLGRVSTMLNSLSLRDEMTVAARLESLEMTMRRMQDSINTKGPRGNQGGFQEVQETQMKQGGRAPVIVINDSPAQTSFAAAAAKAAGLPQQRGARATRGQGGGPGGQQQQGGGGLLNAQGQVEVRGRSTSPSVKRGRDPEWQTVESKNVRKSKKPIRKTTVGTSQIDFSEIGAAAHAGPIHFYIGNTNAKTEKESLREILIKSAENINKNIKFDVGPIEILTKDDNPRSKCWKVTVPHHCREMMENPAMFPPGWRTRRFYDYSGAPSRNRGKKRLKVTEVTEARTVENLQEQVEMEESSVQEEQAKSREELATELGVAGTQMVQGVSTNSV